MANIPFLEPDVEESASESIDKKIVITNKNVDQYLRDVSRALLTTISPDYPIPDVFIADRLSSNLERYVRPNPVRKLPEAWLDQQWVWKDESYSRVAGIPIRDSVIKIALFKKQPILCRVKGFRKYVFIIDAQFALDFAEENNSYEWIKNSRFLIIPIVKFKKVAYT